VIDAARLDVRALRVFEAVAATGSVSAAASNLGVTQSAVSQAISQIEEMLGSKVFDRSRRPIALTPAGIALRRHAQNIVDEMDRLLAVVREADLTSKPEIRVGMIDSYAATVGPSLLKSISGNGNQVLLWAGLAHSQAQALLKRQLDLIITSDPMEDVDKLVRRKLFTENFVAVLPGSMRSHCRDADVSSLLRHLPMIRFGGRSHYGILTERYLRRRGITAARKLEIDADDVVMAMVAADVGWAIASPLVLLQCRGHLPNLHVVPISGPAFTRTIYQISRAGEYEDLTDSFYHTSRHILESAIFPELRSLLPWMDVRLELD
jgi:molybdate transport repressor ModE-like protein